MTGAQLLEALEAASQGLPFSAETEAACAAFMQVSGLKYTVDTGKAYDRGEAYGDNWFKAASLSRVTITEVNGRPFERKRYMPSSPTTPTSTAWTPPTFSRRPPRPTSAPPSPPLWCGILYGAICGRIAKRDRRRLRRASGTHYHQVKQWRQHLRNEMEKVRQELEKVIAGKST
jgi:hypothetical protein